MPTYEAVPRFFKELDKLTREQRESFAATIREKFVPDLLAIEAGVEGASFRASLRVKGYKSEEGVFEMTWDDNGRALFLFGEPLTEGKRHVVWLRVGDHGIF